MPHKTRICLYEWNKYQSQRIEHLNVKFRLTEEELCNLGMQCIHDCYTSFNYPHSIASNPTSNEEYLEILRKQAKSQKIAGNLESTYLLYFLCATTFQDMLSIIGCIEFSLQKIIIRRSYKMIQNTSKSNQRLLSGPYRFYMSW